MEDKVSEKRAENEATEFTSNCYEWLEAIAEAIIPVVIILSFVFRMFTVDGTSMLNTLYDGDKVFVTEWYYKPKGGDVVVIRKGQEFGEPLIKRIIATEGQTLNIDFETCTVTVDGVEIDESPYVKDKIWFEDDGEIPSVVPKGKCFVMGDNRNGSTDSRSKIVGLIDNYDVLGKSWFVVFPFNRIKVIQ